MINDQIIEEVRAAADIVDVVSDYVKLKKSGRYFVGLSPFKAEKSPSFTVTPGMNIYKCFSTGKGGDVFNFLMEMDGVSFLEAVRTLAVRYGVSIPDEKVEAEDPTHKLREGVFNALKFAATFFYNQLLDSDEADPARDYLQKRGLKRETVKKYGLGYAPDSFTALQQMAKSAGINEEYLIEAGVIRLPENGNRPFDYFRGRLMFPIFNATGKVIGFGGRIIKDEKTAKYINSPQTIVYNKSEVLYGIHVAKNAIRKHEKTIMVEGYMDVLSLHQAGIEHVVSSSGTALTSEQAQVIRRYADNLTLIYDADVAGQNAMIKALASTLKAGLRVRLLQLPDGEDPDSFVKSFGGEAFLNYVSKNEKDFVAFLIQKAEKNGDFLDPMKKKQALTDILKQIAHVPDGVLRDSLVQFLSQETRIGDRALQQELAFIRNEVKTEAQRSHQREVRQEIREQRIHPDLAPPEQSKSTQTFKTLDKKPPYEMEIIRLMLQYGKEMIEYIGGAINKQHFADSELSEFFGDIIDRYNNDETVSMTHYAQREPPYPSIISDIFTEEHSPSEVREEKTGQKISRDDNEYSTAMGSLKVILLQYTERVIREMDQKIAQITDYNSEEYRNLRAQEMNLKRTRSQLVSKPMASFFPPPPKKKNEDSES